MSGPDGSATTSCRAVFPERPRGERRHRPQDRRHPVEAPAIFSVFQRSWWISWLSASLRYQSSVNPVHWTEYFDSLNEKITITAIGA
jgi:hypothetical protein